MHLSLTCHSPVLTPPLYIPVKRRLLSVTGTGIAAYTGTVPAIQSLQANQSSQAVQHAGQRVGPMCTAAAAAAAGALNPAAGPPSPLAPPAITP